MWSTRTNPNCGYKDQPNCGLQGPKNLRSTRTSGLQGPKPHGGLQGPKPKVYKDQRSTRTKPHDGLQEPNKGGLQELTNMCILSADKQRTELGKA